MEKCLLIFHLIPPSSHSSVGTPRPELPELFSSSQSRSRDRTRSQLTLVEQAPGSEGREENGIKSCSSPSLRVCVSAPTTEVQQIFPR